MQKDLPIGRPLIRVVRSKEMDRFLSNRFLAVIVAYTVSSYAYLIVFDWRMDLLNPSRESDPLPTIIVSLPYIGSKTSRPLWPGCMEDR